MSVAAGQSANVAEYLATLHETDDVFEVRCLRVTDRADGQFAATWAGWFDSPDAAALAIDRLPGRAAGVYVTLNPCDPKLIARAHNKLAKARETTSDRDIVSRRWLLIDLDPARPAGVSATAEELQAAQRKAVVVRQFLEESEGWPEPLRAMSGNGVHLLYRIDLPADEGGLVRRVLQGLAERFDDEQVKIDPANHNPARIVKVAGTWARKGEDFKGAGDSPARPHRRSWFIPPDDELEIVSLEQLQAVEADPPAHAPATPPAPKHNGRRRFDSFESTPAGVTAYLERHGVAVRAHKRSGDRTLLVLDRCPVHPEIEDGAGTSIAVAVADDGKVSYCNHHARAGGIGATGWDDLREALEPGFSEWKARRRTQTAPSAAKADKRREQEEPETSRAVRHRMNDVEAQRVEWLWFGRIPLSTLTLIAGLPGEAKSFLTCDFAAHVTTGRPWPDTDDPVPVGNVVMMNSEDDLATVIKPRLIQAGADCARVEAFTSVMEGDTERPVNVTRDAHLLEEIIEDWGDVKLVVVDPVLTFLGGSIDMNKENQVREALAPLVRVAQRHRLAVVAVAHLNKSSQMRAIHRITGAGGFSGLPRALHCVEADREDRELRKFAGIKVTSVKTPPTLSFRLEGSPTARIVWQEGSSDETADEVMGAGGLGDPETAVDEAKAFLQSLLHGGPSKTKDVYKEAAAAEISKRTLERAKTALKVKSDRFKSEIGQPWYMMLPKDYPLVPTEDDHDTPS
ncbi:MAG: AAA family ATPase [Planctomycetota bacterium]|nr:AAA family ATPase [Planctomycetota bacterium]